MNCQYKIIINNRKLYREFELLDTIEKIKIGTTSKCEFRLSQETFFVPIELDVEKTQTAWNIYCSDEVYVSRGDMRRLVSTELVHGDVLSVRYAASGDELFELHFLIDFEAEVPDYNWKINLQNREVITIGGYTPADILLQDSYAKESKVNLVHKADGCYIEEISSKYGTYVNGKKINSIEKLIDNSFFSLGGSSFYYKDRELYFDKKTVDTGSFEVLQVHSRCNSFEYPLFNRNTRIKEKLPTENIVILDPPEEPQPAKENIIMNLLPAVAMLVMTVVVRGAMNPSSSSYIIFSVFSMGMGIATSIYKFIDDKKRYKRECQERIDKYSTYLENKKEEISKARQYETEILYNTYYDIERDCEIVENFATELFDRMPEDEDFLQAYIGKGAILAHRQIEYRKQETLETQDELYNMPGKIYEDFKYIQNAPITLNLRDSNAIGIIGESANTYGILKNLLVDIATRHYYGDVKMFALIDDNIDKYNWIRLLPHLHNAQGKRNIVCDVESKNNVFEYLYKELAIRSEKEDKTREFLIIFVVDEHGLKNHPLSKFIAQASKLNTVFIFFEEKEENIPLNCGQIVKLESEKEGYIFDSSDKTQRKKFIYNIVDDKVAERVVERLAPIYCEQISLESSLRKNISLFELLKVYSVDDIDLQSRWSTSKIYESMAAPLGVNAKNEVVSLNLHEKYHGPHGLVAGTTGSGKSEILQSYILSAATLFHPYEIGFVIIDFKGGGMVNQFKDLPHLIGAITNIDGREIDRSLKSIKAELLKRQSLFAEANVNHIDKYIRLFKSGEVKIALPHLVIIVDEFAELKAEQPEFMKELISAARIGRSLGVHLILATQKPSGQVNEQIWSNSKFKLCLKVQNQEDSKEVLKSPLAAEIREPGRAYLQVGNNEIFELFQSAYSGAPAIIDDGANQKKYTLQTVDFSGKKNLIFENRVEKSKQNAETQLEAIVQYVHKYCVENNIEQLPGICLPPLEDVIVYQPCVKKSASMETIVPLGIYDDPDNQIQAQYSISLTEGNVVVIGSSQTGKTTLLQVVLRSIAERYSPEEVSVYIMDFASKALGVFDTLNHVGGVVTAAEDEKMKHLMKMLRTEVARRKDHLAEFAITSFHSYREAGYKDMPHILLMIDNFGAIKELYADYEDDILYLLREGISVGITLFVTALQNSAIGFRFMSNFGTRIALNCNESSEYSGLFDRCRMTPKDVAGRSLVMRDKIIYECQMYLAFEGEREIERVNRIKEFIAERNRIFDDVRARRIPEVPEVLTYNHISEIETSSMDRTYEIYAGMDYNQVELLKLDISRMGAISISGRQKSGRTNFVKNILSQMQKRVFTAPCKVYIFDNYERQLVGFKDAGITEKYMLGKEDFETILLEAETELLRRQEMIKEAGLEVIATEPLLMVVIQNEEIINGDVSKNAVDTFKRLVKLGKTLKMCFVLSNVENVAVGFNAGEMLKFIKENKNIFYFDDINTIKLMDINATIARYYKKPIEVGDAYYIKESEIQKIKTTLSEEI